MVGCGDDKNKSAASPKEKDSVASRLPEAAEPPATPKPKPQHLKQAAQTPVFENTRAEDTTYRQPDDRVVQNAARLQGSDIQRYESKRLILYSDVDPKVAERLPGFADKLFDELTRFFGPLPPNRSETEFQATGYLMVNQKTFRTLGLLTDRVPPFEHGRHLGYEFWVNSQQTEYYSRHLVLHEFTHCFMACVTGTTDAPPAWYMEGMAEFFATHRLTTETIQFGVMPENKEDYQGLGRITFLSRDRKKTPIRPLHQVMGMGPTEPSLYEWSWAACYYLMRHPDFGSDFRKIGTHLSRSEFAEKLAVARTGKYELLEAGWYEFVNQLCDDYDIARAAAAVAEGKRMKIGQTVTLEIAADRGWQSTGVLVEEAGNYRLEASGRFQVDNDPKPWISEPDGVSIRYIRGQRLGCLLGAVYEPTDRTSLSNSFKVGAATDVKGRVGTLCLRVNDAMNSLKNNSGRVTVTIRRAE